MRYRLLTWVFCLLLLASNLDAKQVKNIILVIGDGMGPQQLGLLQAYASGAPQSIYAGKPSHWQRFAEEGTLALVLTQAHNALVTDSACAATQLAIGEESRNGMIGLDLNGQAQPTLVEKAQKAGWSTGLVSDTRITHATPAAFASHVLSRSDENEIARQLIDDAKVDVMLSGGLRHFIPQSTAADQSLQSDLRSLLGNTSLELKSKRNDEVNLLHKAKTRGYELVTTRQQLADTASTKLLGLFASSGMDDGIKYKYDKAKKRGAQPTLPEMTEKALSLLSQNTNGFFLMVEAGQIDWASHNNDTATLLHELIKMDDTLKVIRAWAEGRDDTLIVITADHETGGFSFSYGRHHLPDAEELKDTAGKEMVYQSRYNFGSPASLDRLYAQQMSHWDILQRATDEEGNVDGDLLMKTYNAHSAFSISLPEAQRVASLGMESYDSKHGSFYTDITSLRLGRLGRELAHQQNVLWASGTHTHTPVPMIVWGPKATAETFSNISSHIQTHRQLAEVIKTATKSNGPSIEAR